MVGLTPSETITKLLIYTFFMFAAPLTTYKTSQDYVLPELYRRYPTWEALRDQGSRAVFSGVAAVVAVNVVLVVYVISAMAEENAFGGGGGGRGRGGRGGSGGGGGGDQGGGRDERKQE